MFLLSSYNWMIGICYEEKNMNTSYWLQNHAAKFLYFIKASNLKNRLNLLRYSKRFAWWNQHFKIDPVWIIYPCNLFNWGNTSCHVSLICIHHQRVLVYLKNNSSHTFENTIQSSLCQMAGSSRLVSSSLFELFVSLLVCHL